MQVSLLASFLYYQFRYSVESAHSASISKKTRLFFYNWLPHCYRALLWALRVRLGPVCKTNEAHKCGIVILSFSRPSNIHFIVQSALRCNFVDKVVICNNNPEHEMGRWITTEDPRVEIIEKERPTRQGIRISLASEISSDFVILIDDDVFLYPQQIRALFERLVECPKIPHGIGGEKATESADTLLVSYPFECGIEPKEGMSKTVDHLTRVYCLSIESIRRSLVLLKHLGITDLADFGNGEDLVMSFSGDGPPISHGIGHILQCSSCELEGIATWTSHGKQFFTERLSLHKRLAALREKDETWDALRVRR